ncbi:DUF3429 domain-containing protein [Curvivirga aplysinae]|uniref:DUF3429 domain-containing protein n=1 Tax=Curvivirga aplysinae TaxID=2529852 RepID=UPI0012BC3DB1|nr:DUF3429 domain-containing protein [Curvivirga aplysinae]MTI08994.1 DUF3429 domain-containing protein [Curvivirga aplysinae]
MQNLHKSSYILMYAGTIPFIFCTYSIAFKTSPIWFPVATETALTTYTLLIGSFMAGIHWGQHLSNEAYRPRLLAMVSNLITLSFWFALSASQLNIFLIISAGLFMLLLVIDFLLMLNNFIPKHYCFHRSIVSLVVIINLLTSALFFATN